MRNFLQSSNVIHVTAPYALATGDGCLVGALFGMATGPVANGAAFDMLTTGVFSIAAASAATATAGDKAYWDNTARNITANSAAGPLVGVFTADKTNGQVVATVGLGVYVEGSAGGGGGATAFADLTDKASADLPAVNTPLANALASKAVAYASVPLSADTTLVRATHYNRQIVCDTTAGNITLTATGTDAVVGDFISIDVIGGNSVTLAGVTAQSGYTLNAITGGTVEAKCIVAGALLAATRLASSASGDLTVALVDGDFTANNLNLTASHTNCILSLAAVTVPVTLTWQTDAIGGYSPTSCKLTVIAGAVAPVAIVAGAGATVAGAVQVIEQGCTGTAWRTGLDTLSPTGSTKPQGSTFGANATQVGFAATRFMGDNTLSSYGLGTISLADSSTYAGCGPDGIAEYGHVKRVRVNAAAAAANRVAGVTFNTFAYSQSQNSQFPCIIAGGFSDALTNAPSVLGFTGFTGLATDIATLEPSATIRDMIAIGNDSADTTLSLMHNTNNGTPTKISLGANFPVSQFVAYSLAVWKNNTGTAFLVVVTNMNTKAVFVKVLTTNLPRTTSNFNGVMARGSRSAATVSMDFIGMSVGRV